MHGPHRLPQHRNGDLHWFLRTRFCRIVAQLVIVALLLVDVPVPTDHQAVAEATGSSSSQPRIIALSPSCVARGANFQLILANFDRTRPLTVKVGGVVATIVSTTNLSATTKKLVVTMPQTAPAGRTTVTVSNTKPQSASKIMRVRQAEICGNGVDDDCNGKVDDRDGSGKRCPIINHPPVANAGPDQTRPVGATVRLSACGSSDRDGDRLSFSWSFVAKPAGSTTTLKGATTSTPTFVTDKAGVYTVKLIPAMDAITYTTVRAHLASAMDRVCDDHEALIITRNGEPSVVMLSLEDFKALEETAYLLRTPANAKRLLAAAAQLNAGKGVERKLAQ